MNAKDACIISDEFKNIMSNEDNINEYIEALVQAAASVGKYG